ncbi:MAG: hypothetical protein WD060_14235 [Pirellulales bacterium]
MPSHLYSHSFDQNPDWSRTSATPIKTIAWDESTRRWRLGPGPQLDPVEVRAEVQRDYNERLQDRFTRTVWRDRPGSAWQHPCMSWYVDARGRNTALWPGLSVGYWMAMLRANSAHYRPAAGSTIAAPGAAPAATESSDTPSDLAA